MRRGVIHRRLPAARRGTAHRRDGQRRGARRPQPYASIPRWAVRALRAAAFKACGRRCAYCTTPLRLEAATLDHVVPRRLGGGTTADNLVVACYDCNLHKGGRAPFDYFVANPAAARNFLRLAVCVAHALKQEARVAVSLAHARAA